MKHVEVVNVSRRSNDSEFDGEKKAVTGQAVQGNQRLVEANEYQYFAFDEGVVSLFLYETGEVG